VFDWVVSNYDDLDLAVIVIRPLHPTRSNEIENLNNGVIVDI
jgi:hypothetical protein